MNKPNIERAEEKMDESTERFDKAMDTLGKKVGDTMGKAQHRIHDVKHPKKTALRMLNDSRDKATYYAGRAKDAGQEMVERIKQNPAPYRNGAIIAVSAALVGIMLDRLMSRKKSVIYHVDRRA